MSLYLTCQMLSKESNDVFLRCNIHKGKETTNAQNYEVFKCRLSPLQKHVRKVVGGFGRKSCVSTGVRKPGNTYASPTAMI